MKGFILYKFYPPYSCFSMELVAVVDLCKSQGEFKETL